MCLIRELYGPHASEAVLELNASDDRGIKTINSGVIGNFCHFKLPYTDEDKDKYCKHKLIILDESDNMTEKVLPINEVLLVVDATTGQNGIAQALTFLEAVDITGLVLTKLDGSAKGGVALAIESVTGTPIKFIGTGESVGDFAPFDAQSYIEGLISA